MPDRDRYAAVDLAAFIRQQVPKEWFVEALSRVRRARGAQYHTDGSRRTAVLRQLMDGLQVGENDARLLCEFALKYLKVTAP